MLGKQDYGAIEFGATFSAKDTMYIYLWGDL